MDSHLFSWVILPGLIFLARVIDVSIGTLRIVFIARGNKVVAPILGFIEVLIWVVAVSQIFKHLDNFMCYLAFAGGFAVGNFVGMIVEQRLAIGLQVVRIIFKNGAESLMAELRETGYGYTSVDAESSSGAVKIIFAVIRRKSLPAFLNIVLRHNPKAFYTVEDIQKVAEAGNFALPGKTPFYRQLLRMDRKRK
ncbi:MAG: DUF2179 domain-containing protein [Calditrichaeota bacterium]|nr:DUF2179 domain-containing protein [Calditrichota bacterium]HQU73375.1 DUF2179 domain-containing protein [Calditrichia bacterium]